MKFNKTVLTFTLVILNLVVLIKANSSSEDQTMSDLSSTNVNPLPLVDTYSILERVRSNCAVRTFKLLLLICGNVPTFENRLRGKLSKTRELFF